VHRRRSRHRGSPGGHRGARIPRALRAPSKERLSAGRSTASRSARRRRQRQSSPGDRCRSRATVPTPAPDSSIPCGEGMPADQVGQDRKLATRDLNARRSSAPRPQPDPDLPRGAAGSALFDSDVVGHRDRLGTDADECRSRHRHAVDADGIEAAVVSATISFEPDAIGRERQPSPGAISSTLAKWTAREHRSRRAADVDLAQHVDKSADASGPLGSCNPGGGVGVDHDLPFLRSRREHDARHARRGRPRYGTSEWLRRTSDAVASVET